MFFRFLGWFKVYNRNKNTFNSLRNLHEVKLGNSENIGKRSLTLNKLLGRLKYRLYTYIYIYINEAYLGKVTQMRLRWHNKILAGIMGSKMELRRSNKNYSNSRKNIWIIPIVSRGGKYYIRPGKLRIELYWTLNQYLVYLG